MRAETRERPRGSRPPSSVTTRLLQRGTCSAKLVLAILSWIVPAFVALFTHIGSEFATLSAGGPEQDGAPVKIQELFLAAAESSHIDNVRGVYAHSLERGTMSDGENYDLPVVLEAKEPAIEEMIDARCQKQAVLAV